MVLPPTPLKPPTSFVIGNQLKPIGDLKKSRVDNFEVGFEPGGTVSVKARLKQFDSTATTGSRPRSKSTDRRPIRPAKPTAVEPRPPKEFPLPVVRNPAGDSHLVEQTRHLFENPERSRKFEECSRPTSACRSSSNMRKLRDNLEAEIYMKRPTLADKPVQTGPTCLRNPTDPMRKISGPVRPPPPRLQLSPPATGEPFAVVIFEFRGQQNDELTSNVNDQITLQKSVDHDWVLGVNRSTKHQGIIPWNHLSVKVPLSLGPVRPPPPPPIISRSPAVAPLTLPAVGNRPISPPRRPDLRKSAMPRPQPRYDEPPGDTDSGVESFSEGPRCYTLHDFNSGQGGDLAFSQGEIVRLLSKVNPDWLEGESSDGRKGMFPANFVQILEDLQMSSFSPPGSPSPAFIPSSAVGDDVVTALYDFDGSAAGDLTFRADDKIRIVSVVNDEWLYGQVVKRPHLPGGIFPVNFVDRVPLTHRSSSHPTSLHLTALKSESATADLKASTLEGKTAVALYDFTGSLANELSFEAGDQVVIEKEVDADWLEGHVVLNLTTKRQLPSGLFPRAFVRVNS